MVFFLVLLLGDYGLSTASYINIQTDLFLKMNAQLSTSPAFWLNITELGNAAVFFALLSFFIFWKPQTWGALLCAVPLSSLFSILGKDWFSVPRPAAVLANDQFSIIGKALLGHNSLPSGHTITVFAILTVVTGSLLTSKRLPYNYVILTVGAGTAIIVALSRVAVGAHWPLDIVVGASLGYIGGVSGILLSQRFSETWASFESQRGQLIFGIVMLIWGIALINESLGNIQYGLILLPWLAAIFAIAVSAKLFLSAKVPKNNQPKKHL